MGLGDEKFGGPEVAQLLRSAQLSALLSTASGVTYTFEDLPGTALGRTSGQFTDTSTAIAFDADGAGNGWFIDASPLDNSEFLPTADANVWKARPGSVADGKADLLSVLLHEYGHALGLEHSADARDFMAASLQPGERRLPTADELTLMSRLIATLSTAGDSSANSTVPAHTPPREPEPALPQQQRNGSSPRWAR